MEGATIEGCFGLFSKWLRETGRYQGTKGVYSEGLVMWLMAYQRLEEGASLARALETIDQVWELAGTCKRSRERRVSRNTGGYAQARVNLSTQSVIQACDELFSWLKRGEEAERPLYALDGATLELLRSKELLKRYPSHSRRGHYPLMRILVCHDLETGLAIRPEHGAMYGKYRQGEIELCKTLFRRLPRGAVVVGDRNFGILAAVYGAKQAGLEVIFRLQEHRAKKVLGRQPTDGIDEVVRWRPSAKELKNNPELAADTVIEGRVISVDVRSYRGDKITRLQLFTTLNDPLEKILEIYGKRWNIEIDLRTLKQTVSMQMLKAQTEQMALKELYLGVCAYNLVRRVIREAANRIGVEPRRLSFKRILYAVKYCAERLDKSETEQDVEQIFNSFWQTVNAAKHPNRTRQRVEPRALVRNRRQKYPSLTVSRAKARARLMKKN